MAFLASPSGASAAASFGFSVSEKLTHKNFGMWRLQVTSALKGAQMAFLIDSSAEPPAKFLPVKEGEKEPKPNPDYEAWLAKDQTVLSFILTSLSPEVGGQIPITVGSAQEAWAIIEKMFASTSRAKIISTRMALTTASKGASSITEYFAKMKGLSDAMTAAGKKLEDEELVSYILTGLDQEYESVVSAVAAVDAR